MKTDTLREKFLDFFKKKDHLVLPSAPLVPENDPSLLFTGAGMNQFKDYFLSLRTPPARRLTTCQKCLRTVDMEKVGRTPAHHTFFEMLGNFSIGDYFKKEVIPWAWEFLTEELKIPTTKLSVSVYEKDEEAYNIWHKSVGLSQDKIFKLGPSDNFWPANAPLEGPNGPCGPCSEIFYDLGPTVGCGLPTCNVGCDCPRFVEVWNLVFMEFNRQPDGTLAPLPQKNVDTGMGLERLAAVMQNVTSNFQIDIFQPIIKEVCNLLKVTYQPATEEGARVRRIADHIRALTFTSAEGVLPANLEAGYVVRRILRRAVRDGLTLGNKHPLLYKLVPVVVEVMKKPYPELRNKIPPIARIIKAEETKFLATVDAGTTLLEDTIRRLQKEGIKVFPGDEAFRLYDTYGFPIDLTESILAEKGFKLDLAGYQSAMSRQRQIARAGSDIARQVFAQTPVAEVKNILKETEFVGYEQLLSPVKVIAILVDGKLVSEAPEKTEVSIITEKTPFYAESGGQMGDAGHFRGTNLEVVINDTQRVEDYHIHIGKVKKGEIKSGAILEAEVDMERRQAIARNHTATHLLQSALRQILGTHIEQAGSLVTPERLRFDFSHFSALSSEEIRLVEDMVNQRIMENHPVKVRYLSQEQARQLGALAFFGEKYGETVRLVEIPSVSRELCGGTHTAATGEIGLFKIITESSIASDTRRIEAITGKAVLKLLRQEEETIGRVSNLLETTPAKVSEKTEKTLSELKSLRQEMSRYTQLHNQEIGRALLERAVTTMTGVKIIAEELDKKSVADLRAIGDYLKASGKPVMAVLASRNDARGRVDLVLTISPALAQGEINAGKIIKEIALIIGGSGGGRKDFAQAGGKDTTRVKEALEHFVKSASQLVKP